MHTDDTPGEDEFVTVRDPGPGADPKPDEELLFSRYQVIRELGRGGMGVVLLALDTVLNMTVALKLVPQNVVRDSEGIGDLKKEVLRGMELAHPNIVRMFSFEQNATTAAIVMEHIQGETLAQMKVQRPGNCFTCEELMPILEQLCTALDYAHGEARIAHRDLKPGNLMLTPAGKLKVADFGIASSLSDTLSRVSVRADSSGTPPYMSPQQAMGERPTHLDDIYSLGATVYELLTGKPPFFRGNILAQAMSEVPATMTLRRNELGAESAAPIPNAWEKMVAACLAKEPEDRPENGAAILEMLKFPHRALAKSHPIVFDDLRLDVAVIPDSVQQVYPKPISNPIAKALPSSQPAKPLVPRAPSVDLQPLVAVCSSAMSGLFSGVAALLKTVAKIAIVLGLLWGLLQLKSKWDAGAEKRAAAEAKERAYARPAEAVGGVPRNAPPTYYPPTAPSGPSGPPPGHPGPPPGHRPPPPPRR